METNLSCPVELKDCALIDVGRASLRFRNLSAHRISKVEGVAKWRSAEGRSLVQPVIFRELRAESGGLFSVELFTDRLPNAGAPELLFTRVAFDDGEADWRAV